MKVYLVRSAFNYDGDAASLESGLACDPAESVVQQQFAEDADINVIVKRFGLTGELPVAYRAPVSGDFTGVTDFHSAMNAVVSAKERFLQIPAELRARFRNDPGLLVAFLDDEANHDEAVKLGLLPKPPEVPRDPEVVVPSGAPQGAA